MNEIAKKTVKSHDGLMLYYETLGLESLKPVIFFVHGAGGDVDAWHFVRSQLQALGFASIGMDLRGHGYSSHPRSAPSYEFENYVSDILTVLDQEKIDKVILIGHSFGAIVATHFAIAHPERLNKLVLISSSYRPPNYLSSSRTRSVVNKIIDFAVFLSPKPIRPGHSKYPKGKFHKDYEWVGLARTILRNSLGSYLLASKQIVNLDIKHKLSKIITPTLLIAGTKDSILPLSIPQEIHKEISNSRLELIEGANHVVILNNADETVRLIDKFLST